MIAKRNNKPVNRFFGGGVLDMFNSIHTFEMPEFHARSYLFGQTHNFTGPKTQLDRKMIDVEKRIVKPEYAPIDPIDKYSMHHDLDFNDIKKAYDRTKKTKEDKKHHMKLVHEADERFIQGVRSAEARKADPIVSRIAEYAIKAKRGLEKAGILPTEYISGIDGGGVKKPKKADPAKRLRMLINKNHNKETKHNSVKHHKHNNTNYIIKKLLENKVITI